MQISRALRNSSRPQSSAARAHAWMAVDGERGFLYNRGRFFMRALSDGWGILYTATPRGVDDL